LSIKFKIARVLIVLGFVLNLGFYAIDLFGFYYGDTSYVALSVDDTEEKSESNEKDSSEKEDLKEKDKISQYADEKDNKISNLIHRDYPDLYYENSSVYLEYTTPPPEYIDLFI